jgi:hypothetical protein
MFGYGDYERDQLVTDNPSSTKRKRINVNYDVYNRDGVPNLGSPYYLVVNYNQGVSPPSGTYQYSQFVVNLKNQLKGYTRCSLVHAYLNNTSIFTGSSEPSPLGFLGIQIAEMPGNVDQAALGPSGLSSNLCKPTFLVPTATDTSAATAGEFIFTEQTYNQFSVDVSGREFSVFTVVLSSELFYQLYSTGAPTNYACRFLLRFT